MTSRAMERPPDELYDPVIVTEGSPALTVTLKGINFVRKSAVYFNGRSVPYKAVSGGELQVSAANIFSTRGP